MGAAFPAWVPQTMLITRARLMDNAFNGSGGFSQLQIDVGRHAYTTATDAYHQNGDGSYVIDLAGVEQLAGRPHYVEQVFDQLDQAFVSDEDFAQAFVLLWVQLAKVAFEHHGGVAFDDGEGSAELVGSERYEFVLNPAYRSLLGDIAEHLDGSDDLRSLERRHRLGDE